MDQRLQHVIANDDPHQQRRIAYRDHVERLLELARHLPDDQRLLVQQRFETRVSYRELASLLRCDRRHVERRVRQILHRIADPRFALVAYHIDAIPPHAHETARRIWLQGLSMRQLARTTGPSLHHVRQHVKAINLAARNLGIIKSPSPIPQRIAS